MPDMRLNTALNVTTAPKPSLGADQISGDMSNSQFMDMMMTRLSAMSNDDSELKNLLAKVNQQGGTNKSDNDALLNHLQKMRDAAPAPKAEPVTKKAEVNDKIKAKIKEIAAQDTTPVKDTKAMKALQKVAKFLLKANSDGDVTLPPAMVQKLQEFLAKGDDLKAFDMASFMTDFNDVFKSMTIAMPANGAASTNVQWPDDIKDAFKDLGLTSMNGSDGKPLDMLTVMRAIKSLVNQSEKAALQTLDDKANDAIAAQDTVNLPVATTTATATTQNNPVKTDTDNSDNTDTQAAAPVAAKAVDAAQTLQMTAMGLPTAPQTAVKKEQPSLTQIAKTDVDGDTDTSVKTKDGKPAEAATPTLTSDAVKAATQNTNALAAEVKNAFAAAPVTTDTNNAQIIRTDAIAAPTSLAAKTALANTEILRTASAAPSPAAEQVMAQIQSRGTKSTQISVQLTPAELGSVEVRLNIGKDGEAYAVVMADKPETLALLKKDAAHLERSLQQAGINTSAGNMSFNLRDQNQAQQFSQGRKRFTRGDIGEVKTQEISLSALNDAAVFSDTRINYHA